MDSQGWKVTQAHVEIERAMPWIISSHWANCHGAAFVPLFYLLKQGDCDLAAYPSYSTVAGTFCKNGHFTRPGSLLMA